MRRFLLNFILLSISSQLFSQVLINEFSSSNMSGIKDEDGDRNDWIEVYNHSASDINLAGYHLSDDPHFLKKWTFPDMLLKPDKYLVVFASDKNRLELPLNYQIIIAKGGSWQYIVPSSDIGSSWKNTGFNASSWNTGFSGFGYGDNDDSTVLENIISIYIRKEFDMTNLQDISQLFLNIDYDDGFVAYINGHEIARSNLGTPGSVVAVDQLTGEFAREATLYTGGLPDNFSIPNPASFLVAGTNVLAIEGHNANIGSSDMSLIPMLTLGLSGSGYITEVPPYIQIKGKQLHTNFKISSEGETLIISNPDSSVVDSVSPVRLLADISYGRKADGTSSWFYFADPTPGSSNNSKGYLTPSSDTVIFSKGGGYFPGGLDIELSSPEHSDSIFFTLNGSEPTLNDSIYKGPIHISANSIVRAKSVNYHRLPGLVTTNTYVTTKHTLPVVCLSTDPENLWNYYTGIYVDGPNASPDNPHFGANYWQDWERKAHLEYYDVEGIKQIDQDIGLKIFGAWSRANAQKSLAMFARQEYGKGSLDYKFFSDKYLSKFESLVLRNSGNDWGCSGMRDGLTSTLIRDMNVDRQAFQPTVVYLNGEYWGILNLREKVNPNYLAENHQVNPDDVNILEFNGSILDGTNTEYLAMTSFLNDHTLEAEQNYLPISKKIDIDNYIQYQLTEIYVNNKDWPGNNMKYWKTNEPDSKWRWIIYDTDFGFSIWEDYAYTFNTLEYALDPTGPDWPNPAWATLVFRRMMSNPGFKGNFANQYADRLNTNFTPERVNAVIDSIKQVFLPEINDHIVRWGMDYDYWEYNYSVIKNFASQRQTYARAHLKNVLNLGTMLEINLSIGTPGAGKVKLNSIIPQKYPFKGVYYKDLPIKLTAIPVLGYKFSRWQVGNLNSSSLTLDYNMMAAATITAYFEAANPKDARIIINEINYNSSPEKDTKDWVELYNAGNSTVNIKNWVISDGGVESGFIIPEDIILSPGMYTVVCRDSAAFKKILPRVTNITGDFSFGLSSTGDDINLFDPEGNLVDFINYTSNSPWPVDASGNGASIELINPLLDNNNGKNWKSSLNTGTPGSLNFNAAAGTDPDIPSAGCTIACFPNPFRDYTTLSVEVAIPGKYRVEVYNIQGKLLNVLSDQSIQAGTYYIDWNGSGSNKGLLPDGVYVVRLTGAGQKSNVKVVIMR